MLAATAARIAIPASECSIFVCPNNAWCCTKHGIAVNCICMVLHKAWYCSVLHLHGVAQSMVLQCSAFGWCCTKLGLAMYCICMLLTKAWYCSVLHYVVPERNVKRSCLHGVAQSMILHAVYSICMLLTNVWYCSVLHCMVHCIERCFTKHGIAVYCMALHGVNQSTVMQCTAMHCMVLTKAWHCSVLHLHRMVLTRTWHCSVLHLHRMLLTKAWQCIVLHCAVW